MMEEVCGKDGVLHDGVLATLIPVVILEGALGLEVLVGSLQKLIFQL